MKAFNAGLMLAVTGLLATCSQVDSDGGAADEGGESAAASAGMIQDRSSSSPAEALYVEKCSMCHRALGMGTVLLSRRMEPELAPLEARDDLTAEFVVQAARIGIGNMPAIPRGEVGDADLQAIADYLAGGPGE